MKNLNYISIILITLFTTSCFQEKQDYHGELNQTVIAYGPFTQVTDTCGLESGFSNSWFIFNSDSTFLFFVRRINQNKLVPGNYNIEQNKITLHFYEEVLVSQITRYADAPKSSRFATSKQDAYNQTYWISSCGTKLKFEDENENGMGIEVPDTYEAKMKTLMEEGWF